MATRKKNPKNPPRNLGPAAKMAPPKKGPKPSRVKTAPAGGNQTPGAKKKKR
jgi:hypothetical protein